LLLKLIGLRRYHIVPVFVFDSKMPGIKAGTMDERKKVRQKLIDKYRDATTDEGKRIYYYAKSDITQQEIDDCRELLGIFHVPVVDAAEEADAQLAQLYKAGVVNCI